MIIADSDVLIDFLRGVGLAGVVETLIRRGRLATTAVSVFELEAGIRDHKQERHVTDLLAGLEILPVDSESARRAGQVHRALARKGITIPPADCLIAGICLELDAPLLTRNRRHFQSFKGLQFYDH